MKTLILSVLALLVTLVILRALGIITDEFTLVDCRNHAKNRTGKELSNVELVLVVFFFSKNLSIPPSHCTLLFLPLFDCVFFCSFANN